MADFDQNVTCYAERRMARRNALPNVMQGIEPNQLRNLGVRVPLLGLLNNEHATSDDEHNDADENPHATSSSSSECFLSILSYDVDNNRPKHNNSCLATQPLSLDMDVLHSPSFRRRRNALPDALAILDDKSRQKICSLGSKHRSKHGLRPW